VVLTAAGQHVTVGRLHHVVVTLDGRNAILTLDHGVTVYGSSRGLLTSLNVQSTLYIGRVPSSSASSWYALTSTLRYNFLMLFFYK